MEYHDRNPAKHEYEIAHGTAMIFVGNREQTAVVNAVEFLAKRDDMDHVGLYHTYPSPGPMRRYVGLVNRDGKLSRTS